MKLRALSAALALTLLVLAGCSSKPDDNEAASTTVGRPSVAAPAEASAAPQEPAPASAPPKAETLVPPSPPPPVVPAPKPQPAVEVAKHEAEPPPRPAPVPAATAKEKPVDPLQLMQDQKKAQADQAVALDKARNDMATAQAEVQALEQRLLQTRNPFLPRPESSLPPDEAKEWTKLDGAERVKRVEDQLAAARLKADAARKAYLDLGGRID